VWLTAYVRIDFISVERFEMSGDLCGGLFFLEG
jgi:hypothetical protein